MKVLRDTWLIFGRYTGMTLRNPAWALLGVLQPVLYLLLFAPLLTSLAGVRGFPRGGAYNVFVPGLLIQLGLFAAAFVGFTLIGELNGGVVERLRVTPVSRVALLLGRSLRDVVVLLVESLLLVLLSIPFGLHVYPVGLLLMLGLQALIGLLMASVSYTLALTLRSEDALAGLLTTVTVPLLLLSGFLLPLSLAPVWLQDIALANPLSYGVDAARAIFNDHPTDISVVKGIAVLGCLSIAAVTAGARAFGLAIA